MIKQINGTIGAAVERLTVALRVTGSSPARNKYLYGLTFWPIPEGRVQLPVLVVPRLAVCVCEFKCLLTHS